MTPIRKQASNRQAEFDPNPKKGHVDSRKKVEAVGILLSRCFVHNIKYTRRLFSAFT